MTHHSLVTGASKGIGRCIAKELANRKRNLVLVARSADLLDELAKELSTTGVDVQTIPMDLVQSDSHTLLFDECEKRGLTIDFFANNAGKGDYGSFYKRPLDNHLSTMHLNMDVMVRLSHEFVNRSIGKPYKCYMVNTVSTGAFQAIPRFAVYGSTKAFMLSFSKAIKFELRKSNISVSALCPGPTHSEFFGPAEMVDVVERNDKHMMKPETVAKIAVNGTLAGKAVIIPGFQNKLLALGSKLAPSKLVTLTTAWAMR